ncbi:MAG: hypothetical protein JWN39_40 [Ilumatobacteraceae bacterium]|nr:hypothetical protein [Ilumatobacteraceae bacterium]
MASKLAQTFGRSRWAAIGAAVAVSIGAGGLAITNAASAPGGRSAFVPITPCRLFDTRSDGNGVGARKTPLLAGETLIEQVTGTNGNCSIPLDAVGIAFNVTTVNGTVGSFLTVWPSDATRPLASNLNWVAGAPATPNKVDVKLSPDGKASFFSNAGTVDVIADIVGYYTGLDGAASSRLILDPAAFTTDGAAGGSVVAHNFDEGRLEGGSPVPTCGVTDVQLPQAATLTNITAHVADNSLDPGSDVVVKVWRNPIGVESAQLLFQAGTTGNPGDRTLTGSNITTPVVDNTQFSYYVTVCGLRTAPNGNYLYDVLISYS